MSDEIEKEGRRLQIETAQIMEVFLGMDYDHGWHTFWVHLDYGGSRQHAGTYILSNCHPVTKKKTVSRDRAIITEFIVKVVGAKSWKGLVGHWCRSLHTHGHVYAIGNANHDRWVDFEDFFKRKRRVIRPLGHVLKDMGSPCVNVDGVKLRPVEYWHWMSEETLAGRQPRRT